MENIAAVLRAEGLNFGNIIKTTIFLTNLADFQTVNELYGSFLKSDPPARSTVQVAALPKGANVEIEVIRCESDWRKVNRHLGMTLGSTHASRADKGALASAQL